MAIHAHSTRTPIVHSLLRAAGPCHVFTDAEVIALTAETVQSLNVLTAETLDMLDAIEPAPLPSLTSAFSRRRAIFGAVALAAAPVVALPALASTIAPAKGDARLLAHCKKFYDIEEAISALCDAYPNADCDRMPGWGELEGRRSVVLYQITERRASTLAGIAAKAKVLQVDTVREDFDWTDALSASIADDVIRLHGEANV